MSKKLLDKALRVYLLFSVIVLLVSAPLFYFFTNRLFIDEADETLQLRKKEFAEYHQAMLRTTEIAQWNRFSRDVKILDTIAIKSDSLFYRSFLDELDNEVEPYRVLYSPIILNDSAYTLMTRVNLVESEDIILNLALLFFSILAILLVGWYYISKRLSSKWWRPFYSTLSLMEHFEINKDAVPNFIPSDIEEFARLDQSVNKLLLRNSMAYKSQKEFIENAAHELQTPLATFQVKLDELVQKLSFTQEVGEILSDITETVTRLNRINRNLLLLSKIENNQFISMDSVLVTDILEKQISFLEVQVEERKIVIQRSATDALVIKANSTLVEIAISNLLLNACRHNCEGGQIIIELKSGSLSISNTSNSLGLDQHKIFQRFAFAGLEGGNGLGLAIVAKVAEFHNWSLSYDYVSDKHFFTIIF